MLKVVYPNKFLSASIIPELVIYNGAELKDVVYIQY